MRSPCFHRLMSRLALLAVLMLVLMPAAGRLMEAASEPDGILTQMCTMAGLQMVMIPLGEVDPGAPPPAGGMAMDCEYCLLSAALAVLLLSLILVFAQAAGQRLPSVFLVPRNNGRGHPSGLGSRGPPIAL